MGVILSKSQVFPIETCPLFPGAPCPAVATITLFRFSAITGGTDKGTKLTDRHIVFANCKIADTCLMHRLFVRQAITEGVTHLETAALNCHELHTDDGFRK